MTRKFRKVLKDELEDIICDVCGKSCLTDCSMDDPAMSEYATLEGIWGYCSKKDGERYLCEMCEGCFEKVSAFIDSLKSTRGIS
jgi:hypothetical protein